MLLLMLALGSLLYSSWSALQSGVPGLRGLLTWLAIWRSTLWCLLGCCWAGVGLGCGDGVIDWAAETDLAADTWNGLGGGVGFWSTGVIVALVKGLAGRACLLRLGPGLEFSAFP